MIYNITDYLESTSLKYPDKTAVCDETDSITYSALKHTSIRIGSALNSLGILQSEPVGIFIKKSVDAVLSVFGIAYSGGLYSYFNDELPDKRLVDMQSVLNCRFIITNKELYERATLIFKNAAVLDISELKQFEENKTSVEKIKESSLDINPLYVNFTSGSTGTPKGIAVSHRSVIDFTDSFTRLFGINENDIIASQAPFDFDVSVKDIYSAVKTGATLVLIPGYMFTSPAKLMDYLCEKKITVMIWAVSALCLLSTFHCLEYKTPTTVNKILFSGEIMPFKHLQRFFQYLPDALYVNLYGPTEITCNCTFHILEKDRDYSKGIPIGIHFPNKDVFLLGKDNKKIANPGIPGEICVRSSQLSLGYYNDREKTDKSFVLNPLCTSYPEKIYRTGDIGLYRENGELFFAGRYDNQIKYMGHRIELEEIEREMSLIAGVERCCCIFDSEKQRLCGYYIGEIEKADLSLKMKKDLPVFMVPGRFRKLSEMPLTKNGKIDRKKLAEI